jgi:hypothetical protein
MKKLLAETRQTLGLENNIFMMKFAYCSFCYLYYAAAPQTWDWIESNMSSTA